MSQDGQGNSTSDDDALVALRLYNVEDITEDIVDEKPTIEELADWNSPNPIEEVNVKLEPEEALDSLQEPSDKMMGNKCTLL